MKRTMLTTIGLPYANGEIHLGHMIEAIQADIWVRFQKMQGHNCYYICGSDAHGTATMLSAEKKGMTAEALIDAVRADHAADYSQFHINFDNFYTTHSPENKALSEKIYLKMKENGDILEKKITQYFDEEKQMFLADRFIRGECPKCGAKEQYGDNCEACGATYDATDLKNPRSSLTGSTPVEKESEHYFFSLENYTSFLEEWIHSGTLQKSVANKLQEWFEVGLQPWNISRDKPYFGFKIPGTQDKYFYVWLDAPIGYMASFENLCAKDNNLDFDAFWAADSKAELYHFVGKDIIRFHALFWPATLKAANYRLPTKVFAHGFVTVNGEKMSKSRGTFITAKKYLEHLPAEYLRYYYAAKLTNQVEDIDFNLADFSARVNSDLIGKYVNLASRCAGFITKKFDGKLSKKMHDDALFQEFIDAGESIQTAYDTLSFSRAMREIMALADSANQYIAHHKPWSLAKEAGRESEVQEICTQGLNLFRILTAYLQPILPTTAQKVSAFLNTPLLDWSTIASPLLDHQINKFEPLMQRITEEQLDPLTE